MTLERPLCIVFNPSAGSRDAATMEATVRDVLEQASRCYDIWRVEDPWPLPMLAQRAVDCARQQQAHAAQLRLVVTHQPVHVIRPEDERNLLHGHREAVYAWAGAGVDLILGGHIHLPYVRPLRERFSDLPRSVWVVQAGTAVSSRVRDGIPNSVNLLHYTPAEQPRQCSVERWDHDAPAQRFTLVAQTTIGLTQSGERS